MGVFDEPRNVLKAIPELEYTEMRRNREMSQCCGAGGGFRSGFSDQSIDYASKRVKMAKDAGADVLLTSCPFCRLNMRDGAKKVGIDMPVMNVEEIVLKVLNEDTPPESEAATEGEETAEGESEAQQ
jgi:Fe-S oxidoreductase